MSAGEAIFLLLFWVVPGYLMLWLAVAAGSCAAFGLAEVEGWHVFVVGTIGAVGFAAGLREWWSEWMMTADVGEVRP